MRIQIVAALCLLLATVAWAHEGVKNPAVMARMHSMKMLGSEMKVLGDMAKGTTEFDGAAARVALARLAGHAGDTVELFEANESDPKSEALPIIWEEFEQFTEQANGLELLASNLSVTVDNLADVRAAMRDLGKTCTTCHETYRVAK